MDARKALLLWLGTQILGDDLDSLKATVREKLVGDPIGNVLTTVLLGGVLFYEAEKGHNPNVKSMEDALLFVATSLTSPSSDVSPRTERGKLITTALRTAGPAMAFNMLNAPPAKAPAALPPPPSANDAELQRRLLDKLDAILTELKAQRGAPVTV
jgi:hypothetical protein